MERGQKLKEYANQLKQAKNIVLTGAPGTGKTYLAKQIANTLSGTYTQALSTRINNFGAEKQRQIKEDASRLLNEFQKAFPIEDLKNMTLEQYCIGNGDNNSFSYWLERGLKPLGGFRPGYSSLGHFIYWDKANEKHVVDESRAKGRSAEELMPLIAESIYKLVTTKNVENLPIPNLYQNQLLKILHSYYPNDYFPIFGRQQLKNTCEKLGLKVSKNLLENNLAILNHFRQDALLKNTDSILIMYAIFAGSEDEKFQKEDQNKLFNTIEFTQFHPSYDYTDFVEGLRPVQNDGATEISFQLKNGSFKNFCIDAAKNPNIDFVFIIDEINRGEISKIFGELFYALDPGYRGEEGKVTLQYSNLYTKDEDVKEDDPFYEGFYIPENVYIIGTMNNIDRSVEPFDFAMRRRFQWIEIDPEDRLEMLDVLKCKDEAIKRMDMVNEKITSEEVGLSEDYRIGLAYFLHLKEENLDGNFELLWKYHLEPLLKEYLKGDPEATDKLKKLKEAYDGLSKE